MNAINFLKFQMHLLNTYLHFNFCDENHFILEWSVKKTIVILFYNFVSTKKKKSSNKFILVDNKSINTERNRNFII